MLDVCESAYVIVFEVHEGDICICTGAYRHKKKYVLAVQYTINAMALPV